MSKIEICLIICAVLAPLIAMVFVLPKKMKKEKQPKPVKTLADLKKETVQEVEPDTIEKEVKKQDEIGVKVKDLDFLDDTGFSSDDFKDYLSKRKINSVPTQLKTPEQDTTFSYSEFLERQRKEKEEPKTIKQQINSLSPELKAMLIAGVLDRKKFD